MGAKAMKRKFGKKVINGSMTLSDAWNRLESAEQEKRASRARPGADVAQKSYGSAWSTWPEQPPARRPREPDADYVLEAVRAKITYPQPQPTTIQKARQNLAARQYEQAMAPVREFIAKAANCTTTLARPAPPVVVKQLTQPERAMVAEFRRQAAATADPAKREYYNDQIARITGKTFTWGAV